jgi:A/G-specific adenine glycosylase
MAEQGLNRDLAQKLLAWYDVHARELPWRAKKGVKADPYRVWLSEIMLQQTTVVAVKDYFLKFTRLWPTVSELANAPLDDVLRAWAGLGYYARARNLHACAQLVVTKYKNEFPIDYTGLLSLPGIGPYTAGAISAIAYDQPYAAVDGNVERVISRLYGLETPLPLSKPEISLLAQALVPSARAGDFAQAMMDLGATICAPRKANCSSCPWQLSCIGRLRGRPEDLPFKLPKKKVPTRYGIVFWIEREGGAVLVRTRPTKGLLGGMTEFPSTEWTENQECAVEPPFPANWQVLPGLVRHTFTHFHLELTVWQAQIDFSPDPSFRFVAKRDLDAEAFPSLMRKVMAHRGL